MPSAVPPPGTAPIAPLTVVLMTPPRAFPAVLKTDPKVRAISSLPLRRLDHCHSDRVAIRVEALLQEPACSSADFTGGVVPGMHFCPVASGANYHRGIASLRRVSSLNLHLSS